MGRAVRQFEKEWSWVEEEKKRASLEDRLVSWVWCAFPLKYSLKYSLNDSFEVRKNCLKACDRLTLHKRATATSVRPKIKLRIHNARLGPKPKLKIFVRIEKVWLS